MPRLLISLLLVSSLAGPSAGFARTPDREERLILALRALDQSVRQPTTEVAAINWFEGTSKEFFQAAGTSAAMYYAFTFVPAPLLHHVFWQQTMTFARWATFVSLGAAAIQAGIAGGSYVYRRGFAPPAPTDPAAYKTPAGLARFFRLPINKQYLIAIQDPAFVDYILRLHESLEILDRGFPDPPESTEGVHP